MSFSGRIHPLDLLLVGLFALATIRLGIPLVQNLRAEQAIRSLVSSVDSSEHFSGDSTSVNFKRSVAGNIITTSSLVSLPGIDTFQIIKAEDEESGVSVEMYSAGEKRVKLVTDKELNG